MPSEFLNPKSMLTPGMAGGIITLISNTLLIQFDLPAKWTALVLSVLIALLVVVIASISIWQRAIFCILNSLIIFSVAMGANKVGEDLETRRVKNEIQAAQVKLQNAAEIVKSEDVSKGIADARQTLEEVTQTVHEPAKQEETEEKLKTAQQELNKVAVTIKSEPARDTVSQVARQLDPSRITRRIFKKW